MQTMEMTAAPESAPASRAAGITLFFEKGARPSVEEAAAVFEDTGASGVQARVSFSPAREEGWFELLSSGLTFDLRHLKPADSAPSPVIGHAYGFAGDFDPERYEAIEIVPTEHIVAGVALQPVLRVFLALAANLCLHFDVVAVAWHPAATVMEPRYFSRTVLGWLAGGAFPALGLTAILASSDGSVASRGLAFFTGQELQVEGSGDEGRAETVKLAVRLADHLVREGAITETMRLESDAGPLVAEPSQVGKLVLFWRTA